jgi:hypothetical protein
MAPEVTDSQPALLLAVHEHPSGVDTLTCPEPPDADADCAEEFSE